MLFHFAEWHWRHSLWIVDSLISLSETYREVPDRRIHIRVQRIDPGAWMVTHYDTLVNQTVLRSLPIVKRLFQVLIPDVSEALLIHTHNMWYLIYFATLGVWSFNFILLTINVVISIACSERTLSVDALLMLQVRCRNGRIVLSTLESVQISFNTGQS